jgi:multiple sugar transport system permease protein
MSASKVVVQAKQPREGVIGQKSEQRPPRFQLSRRLAPYLFITPAVIFEFIIHILPMLIGIIVSLIGLTLFYIHYWNQAPFVGLQNYMVALNFSGASGASLLHSFLITFAYTAVVVAVSWLLGMLAAQLLNRDFRGRNFFRTLFLVPFALPAYIEIITWQFMLQKNNGAVNALLGLLRVSNPPFWLIGANAFWSMVMAATWRSWPFAFLFLLAGLQAVPAEMYEAASLDGASKWSQFLSITLPALRPVSGVLVLVTFLWTFNDFNTPYVLFGQSPPPAADLLSLHIYVNSFINWNFGLGSAMSVLLLIFLLIVSLIFLRVFRVGGEVNE